jgi:hypothetical protein
MSKQIRLRTTAALVALASMLMVMLMGAPAGVSQQKSAVVSSANAKSAGVIAATDIVLRETSEIRQLPILHPVKSGAQSRSEIERMVIRNMDEDTAPEEMRASELALKKLGLVPQDFQMRQFLIKLLTEQVAGYYDPKVQEFYLADWIDLDGQKPVMAHELTHALQDQHFNLRRFEKWPKDDSDAELAAHALIEGDATLLMTQYITRNPLRALAFMRSMAASGGSTEQITNAPRALRDSLLFPYQEGSQFASKLFKRDGWKQVSQAYTELPQSTEQILHVDKYFAREAPVKIALPNIAALLGAGWKRIDYDVNGEWSYYLILDEFLKSDADSQRATAGWGGDRYAVYEQPKTGEVMIAQLSAWDTEKDAREFFDAYAKRTEKRYEGATALTVNEKEKKGEASRAWRTNEGNVMMELRGTRVLIAEGVPAKSDTPAVMKLLWK